MELSPDFLKPLIDQGVLGVVLIWFMVRQERLLTGFQKSIEELSRSVQANTAMVEGLKREWDELQRERRR